MHWAYSVLSRTGQVINGNFEGTRQEAVNSLERQSLIILGIKMDYRRNMMGWWKSKCLRSSVLAQFFEDFYNMLDTGIGINQIIVLLKETGKDPFLGQILTQGQERMRQGENLTQALGTNKAFPWIVHSTLNAGESTGRLKEAVGVLAQYFKRSADIKAKMINAAMYPAIVFSFLIGIMFFVSLKVVPKLQSFLPPEAMDNAATRVVLTLSVFLQKTWGFWLLAVFIAAISLYYYYQEHKSKLELFYYQIPIFGNLMKESALALYFLNLAVLLKSGVPLMKAIMELENSLGSFISRKLTSCRQYMLGGLSFSEALKQDSFFPVIVAFTLRKAEETAQIDQYCQNLSEFLTKRAQARVDTMTNLIQPVLLAAGGLFLVLIAFAFLVPIYGSLAKIAGG